MFHKHLSDEYIVFHGTWWQHIKYVVQDREADFIIIHPKKGILILEVKGGQIRYDHFNKIWYQNEKRLKISPFEQAKDIKFKFLDFF
ncbi:nuclease-related domain-containing protein [Cyanobacterium aponinum]|uniref:nuclease-related domain-containing protein n=1 Tax=Cyanobacterium aponinum TaxID=379064 RepID=UPI0009FFF513